MKTLVKKLDFYKPSAQIFRIYHQEECAVFLDSSLHNELGRYSIIGLNPYMELKEKDTVCFCNGKPLPTPFWQSLAQCLDENKEENTTGLPLIAGAIGYFSYDYGRGYESISTQHKKSQDIPEAYFCFYDNFLIEDCENKALYLTARGILNNQEKSMLEITARIKGDVNIQGNTSYYKCTSKLFTANFEKEEYKAAIERMIQYIIEGDIYIANMTQQLMIKSKKAPYEVFQYLRNHNPAPFGSYMNYGDFQVISASPERFLRLKDGWVETRPIKGTRKRGNTPKEDALLKKELQSSEKDRSELLMIVDLLRNDLSRVCEPGSVKVRKHFAVETYATVFHLVSTIVGRLQDGYGIMDLIKATFPGGSITGAPKIRAMEVIDELEHGQRGLYTGSIGYLGLDGSCDLNIVIRTAVYQKGRYCLGVGGGITCESESEFEYEETLQKAKAVLEAIYDGED